ncbi:MAG: NAD(P)H-dependent oxidoreductase [Solirubrobacteraceae bacterium]
MPRLMVIIGSTRPGRGALPVAQWFAECVRRHGGFDLDVVDLLELGLPFLDEPHHPRLRQYTRQHTKDWSARVDAADAFVVVTPEYNHGLSAPVKNALDFLHEEWAHKPIAFVAYGGVSAGTRAMNMLKQVVTPLRMVPVTDAVTIPFFRQFIDDEGRLQPNETLASSADALLDETARLEAALRPLRHSAR